MKARILSILLGETFDLESVERNYPSNGGSGSGRKDNEWIIPELSNGARWKKWRTVFSTYFYLPYTIRSIL